MGVYPPQQRDDHVGAGFGDILGQPPSMIGAHTVVVRQRTSRVDEGLLDRRFDLPVPDQLLVEAALAQFHDKGEIQAGAAVVAVR